MDDKHNKLKRRPSTASSSIGPRGRIDKKRGTRRRKKRHRQFHSKQLADRETSWFRSYDYTYNAIYYYDETNQESEEISHWERPDELETEDYLAEEWETTLDPTTSHYFFTSRLWPRVVVWHVPKDVDWKRKAHVERVKLRWSVASQIMEDMICVLETVDSSNLRFWPHDEKEEKRQLGVSWETREGREELKRKEREVVVVESIEEEEGEGSDTDEAGIHAEEDEEEVTSVLVSVSDGEEDEGGEEKKKEKEEEATTGAAAATDPAMAAAAAVSTEDASTTKTQENVLLDWVLEINDKDEKMTDEWKSRLIGCGEVYELNEKQTLLDIVEAMVLMVEEIVGSEMEKERRREEKQREERERIEEEQRKREEGEEEEKRTTNTEKNDVVDPAEKEAADEKEKEEEEEKDEEEEEELEQLQQQQREAMEIKKDLDDAVLSSLWATMSTHDQHTTRRQRLRSGAQAMVHVTMSHSHHALREARNMAQYHQRLGTLWMKHEQEHRMSEVTQCLEDILETVMWQHEQWESKRTVDEREKYFCTLVDQYMVRGYGENYEGRAVR